MGKRLSDEEHLALALEFFHREAGEDYLREVGLWDELWSEFERLSDEEAEPTNKRDAA